MTLLNSQLNLTLDAVSRKFLRVREHTEILANLFTPEDWMLQSMEDASPIKWNIAHTTWFFETFLLAPHKPDYKLFCDDYCFLFNSYYNAVGDRIARSERGLISRPTASEILGYREYVTANVLSLINSHRADQTDLIVSLILVGCAHEEQHQELLITDINHGLSMLPSSPAVFSASPSLAKVDHNFDWVRFDGGIAEIGKKENAEFSFDNEGPKHRVFLPDYALASRLVTNAEYLQFIEDGGYRDPAFWLSDGWSIVLENKLTSPLYWRQVDGEWHVHSLFGETLLEFEAPVCHLSYYEAAAYAEWSGFRLPTEFEWENAAKGIEIEGNFLNQSGMRAPSLAQKKSGLDQMYGDVWEWTASPYVAYPGYRTPHGAIGEYNGKFMSSQMVLRGGSCATPIGHIRSTYRNFFPPDARWQFSGFRLARDM